MNINKKVIALIVGGLIVIAAIVYFVFFYNFNKGSEANPAANTPTPTKPTQSVTESPVPATIAPVTPAERAQQDASRLSLSFAERYGSSSNQSDFSNLSDLEVFMTDAMIERTRDFVAAEQAKATDMKAYSGIITKAVVADIKNFDDTAGTASALVKTKRQEQAGTSPRTYDQTLSLTLKKVGNQWKVDSAEWLK